MSPHPYTEDQLVKQPAIGLFAELGWHTVTAMEETFGPSPSVPRPMISLAIMVDLGDGGPRYCLDHVSGGMESLAAEWQSRTGESDVAQAIGILKVKFASVDSFGPRQVVEFYSSPDPETQSIQARRAYELVNRLLSLI